MFYPPSSTVARAEDPPPNISYSHSGPGQASVTTSRSIFAARAARWSICSRTARREILLRAYLGTGLTRLTAYWLFSISLEASHTTEHSFINPRIKRTLGSNTHIHTPRDRGTESIDNISFIHFLFGNNIYN